MQHWGGHINRYKKGRKCIDHWNNSICIWTRSNIFILRIEQYNLTHFINSWSLRSQYLLYAVLVVWSIISSSSDSGASPSTMTALASWLMSPLYWFQIFIPWNIQSIKGKILPSIECIPIKSLICEWLNIKSQNNIFQ